MSKFKVSKITVFPGSNLEITDSNYQEIIEIQDKASGDYYTCSVEEFFELVSVVKEFADGLKQTEIEETKKHIAVLEERLVASKKFLQQLEQM